LVPAVVCAECCRGLARTRAVEAVLSRGRHPGNKQPAVRLVPTDFELARRVGSILHGAAAETADVVDAHVVAVAVSLGGGIVITSDPVDVQRLAAAVPAVTIVTGPAR
jgi:predicted nucleic acid-binding protein